MGKRRFAAISPAVLGWALFFFLAPFLLGFLLEAPIPPQSPPSFSRERADLEQALEQAKLAYREEENPDLLPAARHRVLTFETALRFELPLWSGEFYAEGARIYARILQELEWQNTDSDRKAVLTQKEASLRTILEEKREEAFLAFYRDDLMEEMGASPQEAEHETLLLSLKIYATKDGDLSPGENFAIRRIGLLSESLFTGRNAFLSMEQKELTSKEAKRFSLLLERETDAFFAGDFDPVPANTQTLHWAQGLGVGAVLWVLLFCFSQKEKSLGFNRRLPKVLLTGAIFLFSLFLGFEAALACFAPASRVSTLCFLAGHCLSLPFDLALLLRLILTSLSLFPILAGGMRLSRLVSRPVLISLGCALFSLLYRGASFLCTLFLRNSIWIYLLPFPYTDAAESFLGSYPSQGIHAPPLFSLAFLIGLTGILILLPIEKKSSPQSEENSPTESDEASSLPQ